MPSLKKTASENNEQGEDCIEFNIAAYQDNSSQSQNNNKDSNIEHPSVPSLPVGNIADSDESTKQRFVASLTPLISGYSSPEQAKCTFTPTTCNIMDGNSKHTSPASFLTNDQFSSPSLLRTNTRHILSNNIINTNASNTTGFMTSKQADHLIAMCEETNAMVKALMQKIELVQEKGNNSSQVRKRLKFHSSNSLQENVTHATGDISSGRLVTGASNAKEISPVSLSGKKRCCMFLGQKTESCKSSTQLAFGHCNTVFPVWVR